MTMIEICGAKYPLVLTVAALDDLKQLGTSLGEVAGFLSVREGEADTTGAVERTVQLLEVLIRSGSQWLWRNAPQAVVGEPPALEDLRHFFTPGQVIYTVRPLVLQAIADSMGRSIEAVHEKNGEHAA